MKVSPKIPERGHKLQVTSKPANREKEKEASDQGDSKQGKETKERQDKATDIIIKGVRDYGKNECTLELANDFLKDNCSGKAKFSKHGGWVNQVTRDPGP